MRALLCLVLLISACAPARATQPTGGRLPVVATFSVLQDVVANVGGDRIDLHGLVGPGQDAHTFQPSPADGASLARASVVFENGLGFEGWLDDLYRASGSRATRVVVTDGIAPRELDGETDPHAWQDVAHVIHMVGRVGDALATADPPNAALYKGNAEKYAAELRQLDGWVVDQVATLPEARRTLVTSHDTFGYFAERYGFRVLGTVLPTTTEASDPAAAEMVQLVHEIKAAGVPAIFVENVADPKLVERVAKESGVRVAPPLFTDALEPPGAAVDTYPKMVRHNVSTIVTALKA